MLAFSDVCQANLDFPRQIENKSNGDFRLYGLTSYTLTVSKSSRAEPNNLHFSKSNLYEIRFLAMYPGHYVKLRNWPFQIFFTHG